MRILVVGMVFLFSGLARAQPNPSVDEAAARVHFDAGTRFYEQSQWDEAISAFTRAFELAPLATRGMLYYNIAQCHERAGRLREAIEKYNRYLTFSPPEAESVQTERHILELEARIQPHPVTTRVEPRPVEAPRPTIRVVTHHGPQPPSRPGWLFGRRFTWVAGGTSAALGIGAGIAWLLTSASYHDLASSCGATRAGCSSGDVDGVRTGVLTTNVLLTGAGLMLAAAAVLFVIEGDTNEELPRSSASIGKLSYGLTW